MLFIGFPEELVENRGREAFAVYGIANHTSCLKKALLFAAFNCIIVDIFHAIAVINKKIKITIVWEPVIIVCEYVLNYDLPFLSCGNRYFQVPLVLGYNSFF